jgi:hypothetical protein
MYITGSSKMTGNGNVYTVCVYFEADTKHYLGQTGDPTVGFTDEGDLQDYGIANAPGE